PTIFGMSHILVCSLAAFDIYITAAYTLSVTANPFADHPHSHCTLEVINTTAPAFLRRELPLQSPIVQHPSSFTHYALRITHYASRVYESSTHAHNPL